MFDPVPVNLLQFVRWNVGSIIFPIDKLFLEITRYCFVLNRPLFGQVMVTNGLLWSMYCHWGNLQKILCSRAKLVQKTTKKFPINWTIRQNFFNFCKQYHCMEWNIFLGQRLEVLRFCERFNSDRSWWWADLFMSVYLRAINTTHSIMK